MGAARALVVHCGRLIFGVRECGSLCVNVALPVKVKGTLLGQRYRRGGKGLALCETRRAAPQTDVVFTVLRHLLPLRLGPELELYAGHGKTLHLLMWHRLRGNCVGQCLGNGPMYAV